MLYELGISENYVPSWTYQQTIRELMQNALDGDKKGFPMTVHYDKKEKVLHIANKGARLERKHLLLGETSKADDKEMIGQWGEGLKTGILAACRDDKTVLINNNMGNEQWEFYLEKSTELESDTRVLKVEITEFINDDDSLDIEMHNISEDEWEDTKKLFLMFQGDIKDNGIMTSYGEILPDDVFTGVIFVNGIYVNTYGKYQNGYNIKPEFLKLNRDRAMVDTWDLDSITSKMWIEAVEADPDLLETVQEMLEKEKADVENFSYTHSAKADETTEKVVAIFKETHGKDAVPVISEEERKKVESVGLKPITAGRYYSKTLTRKMGTVDDILPKKQREYETVSIDIRSEHLKCLEEALEKLKEIDLKLPQVEIGKFSTSNPGYFDTEGDKLIINIAYLEDSTETLKALIEIYSLSRKENSFEVLSGIWYELYLKEVG